MGDLCSHWTVHACIPILVGMLILRRNVAVCATGAILIALGVWPWFLSAYEIRAPAPGIPVSADSAAPVLVAEGNIAYWNPDHRRALSRLLALHPTLLAVAEVIPADESMIHDLGVFPYQVWCHRLQGQPAGSRLPGFCLLSTWPIRSHHDDEDRGLPGVEAVVDIHGRGVRVFALHLSSPGSPQDARERDQQLMVLEELVRRSHEPVLVMGDCNTTVGCPIWRWFHAASGLVRPRGHEPATWPWMLGPFGITIDHLLVSHGLALGSERTVGLPGSDHRGLAALLEVLPKQGSTVLGAP